MWQYAGFGSAQESNARYRYSARAGRDRAERRLRPADADRLRLGSPPGGGRSGDGWGVAIHSVEDMAALFDGIRLDTVSTSMTINATAIYPAGALRGRGPAARGGRGRAGRHAAERHPQGVRRPRHLHLSAAAVDAPGRRRGGLLRAGHAAMAPGVGQRLSHPRAVPCSSSKTVSTTTSKVSPGICWPPGCPRRSSPSGWSARPTYLGHPTARCSRRSCANRCSRSRDQRRVAPTPVDHAQAIPVAATSRRQRVLVGRSLGTWHHDTDRRNRRPAEANEAR